jgi:hypothetical protein
MQDLLRDGNLQQESHFLGDLKAVGLIGPTHLM